MTFTIPSGSPKHAAAAKFGQELRKAVRARDIPLVEVARAAGVGRTALAHWADGQILPRTEAAILVAEVLRWPKLREIVEVARTGRCSCGQTFRNDGGSRKVFCSVSCREVAARRQTAATRNRQAGQSRAEERRRHSQAMRLMKSGLAIAEDRAAQMQATIAEMCRQCEPDGICRTEDCPLRSFSPLPDEEHRVVGLPRTTREVRLATWTPERRARSSATLAAQHAAGSRPRPAGFTRAQRDKATATIKAKAAARREVVFRAE